MISIIINDEKNVELYQSDYFDKRICINNLNIKFINAIKYSFGSGILKQEILSRKFTCDFRKIPDLKEIYVDEIVEHKTIEITIINHKKNLLPVVTFMMFVKGGTYMSQYVSTKLSDVDSLWKIQYKRNIFDLVESAYKDIFLFLENMSEFQSLGHVRGVCIANFGRDVVLKFQSCGGESS
jgi:hypothetical protein